MTIELTLRTEIQKAVKVLFGHDTDQFQLQPTNKEFAGSHTLVCFPLTKVTRKKPEETASAIGEYLVSNTAIVSEFNVVKGFLNLTLSDSVWVKTLADIHANPSYGQLSSNGEEIMIEYKEVFAALAR